MRAVLIILRRESIVAMPNFLIIGVSKAGTTSLVSYLQQHPQIFMAPQKCCQFFAIEGNIEIKNRYPKKRIIDIKEYKKLFDGVRGELAIGEASNIYLSSEAASKRIKEYIPDAKIIAILRNPADREYSLYMMQVFWGDIPLRDFTQWVKEHKEWLSKVDRADTLFYYYNLKRYYGLFPKNNIKVYFFEDFLNDPFIILKDIFRFLHVDPSLTPDISIKYNVGGTPKRQSLHNLLIKPNLIKSIIKRILPLSEKSRKNLYRKLLHFTTERTTLPPEARRIIIDICREDILKLQEFLGRDLSGWLKC